MFHRWSDAARLAISCWEAAPKAGVDVSFAGAEPKAPADASQALGPAIPAHAQQKA